MAAFPLSRGSSRNQNSLRLTCLGLLLAAATACTKPEREPTTERAPESPTAGSPLPHPTAKSYGQPLSSRPKTPLADVLARPQDFKGQTVLVEGHVRRACSRKGCWMEIATGTGPDAAGCRVTFQDYAFFVPTDSQGKTATVEAQVELSRVKPSHVEHLESEGGTFRTKNPDGSADEVQLTASGVVLAGS